jgi:hypothetical protein
MSFSLENVIGTRHDNKSDTTTTNKRKKQGLQLLQNGLEPQKFQTIFLKEKMLNE